MSDSVLEDLLDGNREHVESLPEDHFADVQDEQRPAVVSICCSDSRVSQEGMWSVEKPGRIFTPSNIGNQVWDEYDGERVVNGNLLYPVAHTGTETVTVVGHTGCGAVTAAYRAVIDDEQGDSPGIEKWVSSLVPVVESGLDSEEVALDGDTDIDTDDDGDTDADTAAETAADTDTDDEAIVNRLVEYNVHRQIEFLRDADAIPDTVSVLGFVYDFQGVYGDIPGRTYLVNVDGETDPDVIADELPAEYDEYARSLLY